MQAFDCGNDMGPCADRKTELFLRLITDLSEYTRSELRKELGVNLKNLESWKDFWFFSVPANMFIHYHVISQNAPAFSRIRVQLEFHAMDNCPELYQRII